jgi:hypothetical protein
MRRCQVSFSASALALVGGLSIVFPVAAEVPFDWAKIRTVTNQVELISATGRVRPVAPDDCLCPGHTLSTNALSQAELHFNEGSLARVGERAKLQFWPDTRRLRLAQGTTLFFGSPDQGRTSIETPNAVTGLQNTAVVVRYVPDRNLTLVMALADASTGPVSITGDVDGQEVVLYAGQMAIVSDAGLQIIEFDLMEFYRTSRLVLGLGLNEPRRAQPTEDPIALLRPSLLSAITQQQPFTQESEILDPALINPISMTSTLFNSDQETLWPADAIDSVGENPSPNPLPPGVVMPLPEPSVETSPPAGPTDNAAPEPISEPGSIPATDPSSSESPVVP